MTTPLLLAEELLLLFLDDDSGKLTVGQPAGDYTLAGALLMELALAEVVHLTEPAGLLKHQNVEVLPGADRAVTDPVLLGALAEIDRKPRTAQNLVPVLSKNLRGALLDRLTGREILRHDTGRVLRIFSTDIWPTSDPSHEQVTRQRLRDVLVTGLEPDVRTAALVALLSAADQAHKVIGPLDKQVAKDVKERAKLLAAATWVSPAVRKAVEAVNAAVMVAVVAATTTATITSS